VLDDVGSQEAILHGVQESGPTSIYYAAIHPGRAMVVVLYGTIAAISIGLVSQSDATRDTCACQVATRGIDVDLAEP
jgi:hypothetical protein